MEQTTLQLVQETFSCSICLELLTDPVSLVCGHNYCMKCIESYWGEEDEGKRYTCPQCRLSFALRPVLETNTMLAAVVEKLKKAELQAAPADLCYAEAEDVACDVCTGRKLKALKSCLTCVVSYCEEHLQPHYQVGQFQKHQLVEPSKKLQENICPEHEELMKMFCRTDERCICYLCSIDDHRGHDTVSVAAERKKRQRELELSRQHVQQKVQDREKHVTLLQKEVKDLNHSADETLRSNKKMFSEMMRLLEQIQCDVEQQVRSRLQTEMSRAKELEEQLEQEITELKKRDAELEELSHTQDHTQFLLSCSSLDLLKDSIDSSRIFISPLKHFEDITAAVSELRDGLQDLLRDKWTNVSPAEPEVEPEVLQPPPPEPSTREEFLKYSCELTLDPNTAHRHLLLSEENRSATLTAQPQSYPDHPDRFNKWWQVLSRESLTGRSYWEVVWRGGLVRIAVAYKDVSRSEYFGSDDKSWALRCYKDSINLYHNNMVTSLSGPVSSRIGVYLDHGAGVLSFYSVSETMTLLHRVQTSFTQTLYAGLMIYCSGDTVEFCDLKQACRNSRDSILKIFFDSLLTKKNVRVKS